MRHYSYLSTSFARASTVGAALRLRKKPVPGILCHHVCPERPTVTPEWLYLFTRRSYLVRSFSIMTGLAILMLADGLLLVRLARQTGVYLALALEGGVTIVAAVILGGTIHTLIRKIRDDALNGSVVPRRYGRLAAVVSAAVLLVLPGFVTDAAGLLLFLPPGRYIYSALFIRLNRDAIPGIYEYLKLELFSPDESHGSDAPPGE